MEEQQRKCPKCGAERITSMRCPARLEWACGSEQTSGDGHFFESLRCLRSQLATLQAENARLREVVGAGCQRRWTYLEYWDTQETHRPYRNMVAMTQSEKVEDHRQIDALRELFQEAGLQSGEEFLISIRKTGNRPFGDRRVRLVAPHTYRMDAEAAKKETP